MYKNGEGTNKDYNKAFELFEQLAKKEYISGTRREIFYSL